jgi:hypothetical protein
LSESFFAVIRSKYVIGVNADTVGNAPVPVPDGTKPISTCSPLAFS